MGILSGLQSDPRGTLISLMYALPAILIALTLHEMAHGYVALRCGDPTAQTLGRLSFNPLHHLDPVGTVFMVLFGFGWAKPVPVNPRNFRNYRRDDILVSIAGVVVNFCLFLLSTLLIFGINELLWRGELWNLPYPLINRRDFLAFNGFNFYAVSSGENVLFTASSGANSGYVLDHGAFYQYLKTPWLLYVQRFFMGFSRINLGLCIFNLLPIPPLDGYHVVNDIFLRGKLHLSPQLIRGFSLGLMAILFFTNFVSIGISKVMYAVQGGVVDALLAVTGLR